MTLTLFGIMPISGQGPGDYDPWYDVNDDGWIDMRDIAGMARKFGSSGSPVNKTELLLDLLDRLYSIEERQEQKKVIRLFEPDETMSNSAIWKDAAVFEWTPNDISNNTIILISYYAEYKAFIHPDYESMYVYWRIVVNDSANWDNEGFQLDSNVTGYTWTPSYSITGGTMPNQASYTIKFQISTNLFATAYFRNINVIITVMDGLPDS